MAEENYQLSMSMQNMNLCGQRSQYIHYEVIAYADDGGIISRHQPNSIGQVQATFDQSHVNLAIVRDTGTDTTDKKNLDVTALTQYPVGDLGTLTIAKDDTEGCQCQTATIKVQPGGLTTQKLNFPYSGFSGNITTSQFNNTQLYKVEEALEALLVVNHLDNDIGYIYYQTIANTSQRTVDGVLSIDIMLTGQVGREIFINAEDQATQQINYVTDQTYNYSVPGKSADSIYVLDHERVEKIEFHASRQLDILGISAPVGFWGVHVPMTDDTIDISYSKPEFESSLLDVFLDNPTSAYNLDGAQYRVLTGYVEFSRPDGTEDVWHYILPSQSDEKINFELPADYMAGLDEGSRYQDLAVYRIWDINEIPALNSLDELYQSDWLKVLLPTASETRVSVRPPATYSYVSQLREY